MFKSVGIIAKAKVENLGKIVLELIKYLNDRKIDALLGDEIAKTIGKESGIKRSEIAKYVDLIIVLGGDGTFISAARSVSECDNDVPILGINLGRMGFLTEVPLSSMYSILDNIFIDNNYKIENRMMIDAKLYLGNNVYKKSFFNDAAINNGALARIIGIKTHIIMNNVKNFLAVFHADGLIVSTPSGSTAYSLSAGGPIVYPTLDCFIITPICPHTLSNRPLVIPKNAQLIIELEEDVSNIMLTLDGQIGFRMDRKDKIILKKSNKNMRIITSKDKNYFDILRTKLGWEERKIRKVKC